MKRTGSEHLQERRQAWLLQWDRKKAGVAEAKGRDQLLAGEAR